MANKEEQVPRSSMALKPLDRCRIHENPIAITIAVDCQKNRLEFQETHWGGEVGDVIGLPRVERQVRITRTRGDSPSSGIMVVVLLTVPPHTRG